MKLMDILDQDLILDFKGNVLDFDSDVKPRGKSAMFLFFKQNYW